MLVGVGSSLGKGSRWDKVVCARKGLAHEAIKSRRWHTHLPPHSLLTESAEGGREAERTMWLAWWTGCRSATALGDVSHPIPQQPGTQHYLQGRVVFVTMPIALIKQACSVEPKPRARTYLNHVILSYKQSPMNPNMESSPHPLRGTTHNSWTTPKSP